MILCDREIEQAISEKRIIVKPSVHSSQYDSSALNLRVGDDFLMWKEALRAAGTSHFIHLDSIELSDLIDLTEPLRPDRKGIIAIPPGAFVLVRTREHVTLPPESKLAARVEGRSKQARLA